MTIAGNSNNRSPSNRGNAEWQALRTPHEQNGGCRGFKQRSHESEVFEIQLRALLKNSGASDISGVWIDWTRVTREAKWIPAPGAETDAMQREEQADS